MAVAEIPQNPYIIKCSIIGKKYPNPDPNTSFRPPIDFFKAGVHEQFYIVDPVGFKGKKINAIVFPKDKLIFSIRRFEKVGRHNHVIVYCHELSSIPGKITITRHTYYQSVSDGNFWRYCVTLPGEDKYDKGYNYVATTFINIDLQSFLFNEMDSYNMVTTDGKIKCPSLESLSLSDGLRKRITLQAAPDVFDVIDDNFQHVSMFENYGACIKSFIRKYDEIQKKQFFNPTQNEKFNRYVTMLRILKSNNVYTDSSIESDRTNFFTRVYKAFGEYFNEYFYVKNPVSKFVNVVAIEKYIIIVNVIEGIMENKKTHNDTHKIHYITYIIKDQEHNTQLGEVRKAIINIIPILGNHMTNYGLDAMYISAGAMVNKIFDYTIQLPITKLRGESESPTYRFMGHIIDMKWLPVPHVP